MLRNVKIAISYVVAALPATKRVDMAKVANALGHGEVGLASEAEIARRCPDCEVGSLPPFGSQYGMKTLVDEGLTSDEEIVFEVNEANKPGVIRRGDEYVYVVLPMQLTA